MTYGILNRDIRIYELNKKRKVFSNDVSKIKRYKFKLKEILNDGRRFRNRSDFDLEDKICSLLQTHHIKEKHNICYNYRHRKSALYCLVNTLRKSSKFSPMVSYYQYLP